MYPKYLNLKIENSFEVLDLYLRYNWYRKSEFWTFLASCFKVCFEKMNLSRYFYNFARIM